MIQKIKKRKQLLTDSWQPTEETIKKINEKFEDINHDIEKDKFRNYHIGKGNRYINWDRAYQNWCRNHVDYREKMPGIRLSKKTTTFNGNNAKASIYNYLYHELATKNS